MSGDYDPRDFDSLDRQDGIHDREDQRLVIGRGPGLDTPRDDALDDDTQASLHGHRSDE